MVSWTASILPTAIFLVLLDETSAFVPARHVSQSIPSSAWATDHHTTLAATGGKRKKRRRKKPVAAPAPDPIKLSQETIEGLTDEVDVSPPIDDATKFELKPDNAVTPLPKFEKKETGDEQSTEDDLLLMKDVANFEFKSDDITKGKMLESLRLLCHSTGPHREQHFVISGIQDKKQVETPMKSEDSSAIPLPDIKEALRKKEMEKELARMEEEKEKSKPKIKRSDKDAFTRVCLYFCLRVPASLAIHPD